MKEEILQQVAKVSLDDSVYFLGRRDDIPRLLRAMDAFVLPSIGSEGMPLVILEAMAAGVPCIASLLSGIPEVINDCDVGLLLPPGDESALGEAMITLAHMPRDDYERLTEKARDRIRRFFAHEVVREKLKNLYEKEFEAGVQCQGQV